MKKSIIKTIVLLIFIIVLGILGLWFIIESDGHASALEITSENYPIVANFNSNKALHNFYFVPGLICFGTLMIIFINSGPPRPRY